MCNPHGPGPQMRMTDIKASGRVVGIGIPVAAGVLHPLYGIRLSPIIAAAAMARSSLWVLTNASRLRRCDGRCRATLTVRNRPEGPLSDLWVGLAIWRMLNTVSA